MFVPVVSYPLDNLSLISNLPPQPLLIPLIELLMRVCGIDESSSSDIKLQYICILLQLLRLVLPSYGPRPGMKPSTDPDLLLSALLTAVKAIGSSIIPLRVAPLVVRELLALTHSVLDIARSFLVPKAGQQQQQGQQQQRQGQQKQQQQQQQQDDKQGGQDEHQQRDQQEYQQQQQQQQQCKGGQQGVAQNPSTEHSLLQAQQFLHAAGCLIMASQAELANMVARTALETEQPAAVGAGPATEQHHYTAGGAGAAAAAAGGGGGAGPKAGAAAAAAAASTNPIPHPAHAGLWNIGFRPVPTKEGCGFMVYHAPNGRYVAVGPALCTAAVERAAWDFATSVAHGMDK